jgi:hypothetical protein
MIRSLDLPQSVFRVPGIKLANVRRPSIPMRRVGMKALLTFFVLNRSERKPEWDRIIIICSTAVTIGLVAAYAYGKATSRW